MRLGALILVLVVVACSAGSAPAPERNDAEGPAPDSVDELVSWLGEHPDKVAVAVIDSESGDLRLAHRADDLMPLASVRKVLVLGAYAEAVAAGEVDPESPVEVADVERWWIPGTDGGAHDRAIAEARDRGWVDDGTVELDRVVWAMVRWSDNAAADFVLAELGADAVDAFAERHDMRQQEPIMPAFGQVLAWSTVPASRWEAMTPQQRADEARRLASSRTGPLRAADMPPPESQRRLALTSTRGTASEWARLMHDIATGHGFSDEVAAVMSRHLSWPIEVFPDNAERFSRFGAKGGSLVGVMAEAAYIEPQGGSLSAIALFFADLSEETSRSFRSTFVHQQLLVALAEDPGVADALSRALG